MNRVERQLKLLESEEYRKHRTVEEKDFREFLSEEKDENAYYARLFYFKAEAETPLFHGEDIFGFNQSVKRPPFWRFGNITIDFETALKIGLDGYREKILSYYARANSEGKSLYDAMLLCLDACNVLVKKYKESAKLHDARLYNALKKVPMRGASNYYEACVTIRFLIYVLRLCSYSHIGLGRFDKYMLPYYEQSKKEGVTDEEILEITRLFFIAINFDTDLYSGCQKGDNGQSMVLGGCDNENNPLTEIALLSAELNRLIDPKINVRVHSKTPLAFYERCTRLTKLGIGFPQYVNDDIVVPALLSWGYEKQDAINYSIAACWEVISSGNGADVPNDYDLVYPIAVEKATKTSLLSSETFDEFFVAVKKELDEEFARIIQRNDEKKQDSACPFLSIFVAPCIERGVSVERGGAKYNNIGFHGTGISTAADSLSAIKRFVFDQKTIDKTTLLTALDDNFEGYEDLREKLSSAPKMGNNDDFVDEIAVNLMEHAAHYATTHTNSRGATIRLGTGSALDYFVRAGEVGATADGKKKGEYFACNYSPSINAKVNGPLSVIQSFTKMDLKKVANGGPLTLELHDTLFRNDEGERKVAMLVKSFIDMGGHQLQLNAVNREILLDAQKNPRSYRNLIVRVWGWSGYFVELEKHYQDHIISRIEFAF